ncbi:MAG: pyridoxal-dependent decarboxylase [Sphingomonadales bacterium]
MDINEFRTQGHRMVDWVADYLEGVDTRPVRAATPPGAVAAMLPEVAPESAEAWDTILADLDRVIMPGITHWQHPMFMAYFPCISSPPAILAELIIGGLGVQGMMWETSPAATELETRVLEWLARAMDLPPGLEGVIQDSASTSTLCAVLAAREAATAGAGNAQGGTAFAILTAYASADAHSSVQKAMRIAGIGDAHFRAVALTPDLAMDPAALDAAITRDRAAGLNPAIIVATLGATGTGANDDLDAIGAVAKRHGLWLHVDAAWAGNALLLPEQRAMARGLEAADSLVVNPHKWLYTGMDLSALYVKSPALLERCFSILPEYLRTAEEGVINYRDRGITLGRRFRALKLWFVMRSYGLDGLRTELRRHIALAHDLGARLEQEVDFEIMVPPRLALVVFRFRPMDMNETALDAINENLLNALNETGQIYLTRIRAGGHFAIRVSVGQTGVTSDHMDRAFRLITDTARTIISASS